MEVLAILDSYIDTMYLWILRKKKTRVSLSFTMESFQMGVSYHSLSFTGLMLRKVVGGIWKPKDFHTRAGAILIGYIF